MIDMDKAISRHVNELDRLLVNLYTDGDMSYEEWKEHHDMLSKIERHMLKADRAYDRKHEKIRERG